MQMKADWKVLSTIWMLAAATVAAAAASYGLISAWLNPSPWNFPGDPPLFEGLACCGIVSAWISLPLWLLARRPGATPRFVVVGSRLTSIASVIAVLIPAGGILERQDARWGEIRAGIRQYGERIAAATGDKDRVLSHDEFERLKQQFVPTPVTVQLPGHGPVRLRMAHAIYPYVGVDFSDASHAFFEPRTMWCTYSD
jgi:hypothetical protein